MPIFVALGRSTDVGMRNLDSLAQRHERAVKRAEDAGGKVLASYALMGRYDYLAILECPDAQTALRILVKEAAGGNVRYETMVAIPIEEFGKLVEA